MNMSCSCGAHHRCAHAFIEHAIARAMPHGTRQVMNPTPALRYERHRYRRVCAPSLNRWRRLGRFVDTTYRRASDTDRVTAAERGLLGGTSAPPGNGKIITECATNRREKASVADWHDTTLQQPPVQTTCGVCHAHMEEKQRFGFSPVDSLTRGALWKAHTRQDKRGTTSLGWPHEEKLGRRVAERFTYYVEI